MKKLVLMTLMFTSLSVLFSQATLSVFKIDGEGIDAKTLNNVNDTVYAFLAENKDYKILDCRTFSSPEAETVPEADFYFYGKIESLEGDLKLDLVLKTVASGTTRLLTNRYPNVNMILLESKSLLEKLLDQNYEIKNLNVEKRSEDKQTMSDGLAGTWLGEEDIRNIKLLQNGRGVVIFKTGLSVSVDFEEKDGLVSVVQKSSISERQFPNLSKELAGLAIKKAEPLRWILKENGNVLSGTRSESVANSSDNKTVTVKIETKNATWTKLE